MKIFFFSISFYFKNLQLHICNLSKKDKPILAYVQYKEGRAKCEFLDCFILEWRDKMNYLHKKSKIAKRQKENDLVTNSTQEIRQFELDNFLFHFSIIVYFVVKLFWVVIKIIYDFVVFVVIFVLV